MIGKEKRDLEILLKATEEAGKTKLEMEREAEVEKLES